MSETPDKHAVARALEEISRLLELQEPNRFRSNAFRKAARSVEAIEGNIAEVIAAGDLEKTPGIGKAIGPMIREIVETGSLRYLDELRKQYPPGIFQLMKVQGLGLKKIAWLYENLSIATIDDLESAAREGKLRSAPGFGKKTEEKILAGVEEVRRRAGRFLLPSIEELSNLLRQRLEVIDGVTRAAVAGSVRRKLEIVQNINLVVETRSRKKFFEELAATNLMEGFQQVTPSTARGSLRGDLIVEVTAATRPAFATTLFYRTGSAEFVDAFVRNALARGFSVREDGVFEGDSRLETGSEEELFRAVDIAFVPPELRETSELPAKKRSVTLIVPDDVRGAFHVHTTYSDGRNTLYEMLDAASDHGLQYVGISDHSKTAAYAGGLDVERLTQQHAEIEKTRKSFPQMTIFKGTEADILQDGAIDWPDDVLPRFDFVIASVHSRFKMEKDEMTERIVRAIRNPFVTFIGHLTGRLLLARPGYEVDYDRIFDEAATNEVMIEINGNPNRLDLDWRLLRRAADKGVRFSVNPDAHSTAELDHTFTGVWVARKGGLSPEHIFNTLEADAVAEFLIERRARALRQQG